MSQAIDSTRPGHVDGAITTPAAGPEHKAILLMAFGGPESADEIGPFLESLLGRTPPPALSREVTERYEMLGGRSPLPEVTRRQADALEAHLARHGASRRVYVGMQHAHPTMEEAFEEIERDGVTHLVAVSLAPYRSQASTQAYEERVRKIVKERRLSVRILFPEDWYRHPRYVDGLVSRLNETLEDFAPEERGRIPVIFSAHSLPVRFIEEGDPYVDQLKETIEAVDAQAGPLNWRLAFQSKGAAAAHTPWLDPEVEEVMDGLRTRGHRAVVVDPIGFVTDHMETLYDNEVLHRQHAAELRMRFARVRCLNLSPAFIEALADVVSVADTSSRVGEGES